MPVKKPPKRERSLYEIASIFFAGCVILFALVGIVTTLTNGDGPGSVGFIASVLFLLMGLGRLYVGLVRGNEGVED